MTTHRASPEDYAFARAFEVGDVTPQTFDHASHVRLAYIYLCDASMDVALDRFRGSLRTWLAHHAVDPSKYHETITRAWLMAVAHFMSEPHACDSSADFVARHPRLLDRALLLAHYSEELLFSPLARREFVQADRRSLPG